MTTPTQGTSSGSAAADRHLPWLDWWLPKRGATSERDQRRRARLVAAFALAIGTSLLVLGIRVFLTRPDAVVWRLLFIGAGSAVTNLMLLRRGLLQVAASLFVLEGFLFLGAAFYITGGLASPAVPWIFLLPILGTMLLGPRAGLACTGLGLAEIGGFFALHQNGFPFPPGYAFPHTVITPGHVTVYLVELLAVGAGAFAFESVRLRNRMELAWSEERYQQLFENHPTAIAVLDGNRRYVAANRAYEQLFGYPLAELTGAEHVTVPAYPPGAGPGQAVLTATPHGTAQKLEEVRLHRDGSPRQLRTLLQALPHSGALPGTLVCVEDVTALQQMEARVRLTERLASLGTLVAGIAHEMNTPLAYMQMNLEALEDALTELNVPPGSQAPLMLSDVRDGSTRIATIVRQLKQFTPLNEEQRMPLDLRPVVDAAVRMTHHQLRHHAEVLCDYQPTDAVLGDASRLGQVFVSLLINAADAIPEGNLLSNRVTITTGQDGSMARVSVSDTGCGIPEHIRPHVFDPFFTTKPVGRGTGLGLAIAHGIVTELGGRISVESIPGRGSTFTVWLPTQPGAAPAACPQTPRAVPLERRILVVDDDVPYTRAVERLLRGHHVRVVLDGRTAVQMCVHQEFDVVLCDLMMPLMSGQAVYEAVKAARPGYEKRFVFATGGAFSVTAANFIKSVPQRTLSKPFDKAQLLDALACPGRTAGDGGGS